METAQFFSCPQLSLTLLQGLSAAPRNAVTQGEIQGKLTYTEHNAKDFLVKQNMFFLMSTCGFRVMMDVRGHLSEQHTGSAQEWRISARAVPPLSQLRKHLAN